MSAKRNPRTDVHAGQTYRAKARCGYRYILILAVRGLFTGPAYVNAIEILPSGKKATGWFHGVNRATPMRISLTYHRGVAVMPSAYERVDLDKEDDRDQASE